MKGAWRLILDPPSVREAPSAREERGGWRRWEGIQKVTLHTCAEYLRIVVFQWARVRTRVSRTSLGIACE
jgi:hypothetical protein